MGNNEKNKWLSNYLLLDIPSPFSRRLPTYLPKSRCRYHILLVGFRRIPEVMGGWRRGCGGGETVRGLRKCRDSVMWYISAEDAPPVACRVVDSDRPLPGCPLAVCWVRQFTLGGNRSLALALCLGWLSTFFRHFLSSTGSGQDALYP